MKRWVGLALGLLALAPWAEATMSVEPRAPLRITVVYNNMPHVRGLGTAWGFAAVVETGGHALLFDTGGDGPTLLDNLRRMGIDPASIEAIALSHGHGDHTGGLDEFLAHRSALTVYVPRSLPAAFSRGVERRGARVEAVGAARRLFANLHSTGEMGSDVREQALIVDTPNGLVVITGCAHPGIVEVARTATAYLDKDIRLLMGGFHLLRGSEAANRATIETLRALGVRRVAPSHCTGDNTLALFRAAWGEDFIAGGCGAVIELP